MLLKDEEIARAVDVSRSTVERWRSGQTAPLAGVMPLIIDGIAKAQLKKDMEWMTSPCQCGANEKAGACERCVKALLDEVKE